MAEFARTAAIGGSAATEGATLSAVGASVGASVGAGASAVSGGHGEESILSDEAVSELSDED